MSKLIQREIRRSLPVIMIALIVNLSVYGLIFNLTFGFDDALVKWLPSANADVATSSVTVKNAAPTLTVVAELNVSSSTSPINVGSSISFAASSTDPENNNYYLLVCATPGAVPGATGGVPSCSGTQICVSASTTISGTATCTNAAIPDPGAESQAWYAYSCDDYSSAGQAACSIVNQGGGDSGSPYFVNHRPTIASAATVVDNRDPGQAFTFRATTTDTDTQGGNDVLQLDVCKTNSYSTSTGCTGGTWCSATTTANGATAVAINCSAATTIPWPRGASTTYAFVKDWHNFAAVSSQSFNFTTNNVAPTVGYNSATFNNGAPIITNIKGAASTTVWASSTSVSDNNGCSDIVSATSTFSLSSLNSACTADNNNCYQIPSSACTISNCVGGTTVTVNCSAQIAFHAIPTTASGTNPHAADSWVAAITPYDGLLYGSGTSTPVELNVTTALDVAETTIDYGIMIAGTSTGATTSVTTVVNYGNSPIGNNISGTWMSNGGNIIAENNQKFGASNVTYSSLTYNLSSTTPQALDLGVTRPTSQATSSAPIYWGIFVPAGRPSGTYSGTNTFSVFLSAGAAGLWN